MRHKKIKMKKSKFKIAIQNLKSSHGDTKILHFDFFIFIYRTSIFPTVPIKNPWIIFVINKNPKKIKRIPITFHINRVPPLVPNFSSAQALAPKFTTIHSVFNTAAAPTIAKKIPIKYLIYLYIIFLLESARERTRTSKPCGTGTSSLRVYQFRHPGLIKIYGFYLQSFPLFV